MKKLVAFLAVMAFAVTAEAGPAVPGALAYWSFDADDITDDSGNGYNGTVSAPATFSADVPANIGGGKSLNGTSGGGASVADGGDFNIDTLTVAFWIKGTAGGPWVHAVTKGIDDNRGWMYRSRGEWNLGLEAPTNRRTVGLGHGDANEWNHMVLQYSPTGDQNVFQAWRNFNEATNSSGSFAEGITNEIPDFRMLTGNGSANQMLDEVYIFDRILTEEERFLLFQPPTATAIPEPSTFVLSVLALLSLGLFTWRRRS